MWFLAAMTSAVLSARCATAGHGSAAGQSQQWLADSAAYETRLSRWLRDSVVIESLSRSVSTDSLYHLYRAMYVAQNPRVYVEPIMCFESDLVWRHGRAPAEVAMRRLMDTLWKPGEGDGLKVIERRMPTSALFSMSDSICGPAVGRRSPDTVSGTWLGFRFARPARPQPPP